MAGANPVTTEIISHNLTSICEEMMTTLMKAAYSPNIKERADCSTAMFGPTGEIIAQAPRAVVHMGGMLGTSMRLLEKFPAATIEDGDIFICNDPHLGGANHLNDVSVVAPVFHQGILVALVTSLGHHADLGGRVPGGEAFDCASIFEEGVRIPPIRIARRGELSPDIVDLICANSRNPREVVVGDLRAQLAAVNVGKVRVREVVARYGVEPFELAVASLLDATERRFRAVVAQTPDGEYEFTDWEDDDWVTGKPFGVHAKITIAGAEITVDLSNNIAQVEASRNVPRFSMLATVYYALKAVLDPDVLPNSGYFRAVKVIAPPGLIINAIPPAAVGCVAKTCQRLAEAMIGALSKVVPDRVCAGGNYVCGIQYWGEDPVTRAFFLGYDRIGGGFGARATKDGPSAIQVGVTNTSNLPIESMEAEYPAELVRYEIIPDSGGAGRLRGGLGIQRDIRFNADGIKLTAHGARQVMAPYGLFGGHEGKKQTHVLNPGTAGEQVLPHVFVGRMMRKGDVFSARTAGGGGFGDPRERDPERVLQDVRMNRVTIAGAARDYGVVIDPQSLSIDHAATRERRGAIKSGETGA